MNLVERLCKVYTLSETTDFIYELWFGLQLQYTNLIVYDTVQLDAQNGPILSIELFWRNQAGTFR